MGWQRRQEAELLSQAHLGKEGFGEPRVGHLSGPTVKSQMVSVG